MKHLLLFFASVCLSFCAIAQKNITIHGTADNAAGRKVEITRIADPISNKELLLDSTTIGNDGQFRLRLYTNYPMLVTMQIENYSQAFYIEPATDYDIHIPEFDWNLDEKRNVFLDPEPLPLVFKNLKPDDINILIDSIDRVIARFIDENRTHFDQRFKPSASYFDSLAITLNRLCPDGYNQFVNRYKVFQLAELKYSLKFDSRKKLINKYIKGQPILYNDENYMALFSTLYAYSISPGTKQIPVYRLAHWVYNLDVETYIDSIGTDPLLRHEQVRELAALQALRESYFNFRYYDPEMVVKMIQRIAQKTKFPEHKIIAQNIIDGLPDNIYQEGEVTDLQNLDFNLPNVDKQLFSLNSLKGKWVYIAFVRTSDPNSVSELETMAHFKDRIYSGNGNVAFVTIACDREFQKMYHFLKNTKHGDRFPWTWLHFDGNYDLLRHFQISSYPWFVLINPDGRIHYNITPAPSTGFLLNAPWQNTQKEESTSPNKIFR